MYKNYRYYFHNNIEPFDKQSSLNLLRDIGITFLEIWNPSWYYLNLQNIVKQRVQTFLISNQFIENCQNIRSYFSQKARIPIQKNNLHHHPPFHVFTVLFCVRHQPKNIKMMHCVPFQPPGQNLMEIVLHWMIFWKHECNAPRKLTLRSARARKYNTLVILIVQEYCEFKGNKQVN